MHRPPGWWGRVPGPGRGFPRGNPKGLVSESPFFAPQQTPHASSGRSQTSARSHQWLLTAIEGSSSSNSQRRVLAGSSLTLPGCTASRLLHPSSSSHLSLHVSHPGIFRPLSSKLHAPRPAAGGRVNPCWMPTPSTCKAHVKTQKVFIWAPRPPPLPWRAFCPSPPRGQMPRTGTMGITLHPPPAMSLPPQAAGC